MKDQGERADGLAGLAEELSSRRTGFPVADQPCGAEQAGRGETTMKLLHEEGGKG